MTVKCAALNCRSGYKNKKRDAVLYKEGETSERTTFKKCVFRFSRNKTVRDLWLKALGGTEFDATQTGVCEKHFKASDLRRAEKDDNGKIKRTRLQPNAVPSIFDGHVDSDTGPPDPARPTKLASSSARQSRDNKRLEDLLTAFQEHDSLTDLSDLQHKLQSERLPSGFRYAILFLYPNINPCPGGYRSQIRHGGGGGGVFGHTRLSPRVRKLE